MEFSSSPIDYTTRNNPDLRITLIGTGTIGLSFAAFHLTHLPSPAQLTIYDPRPDLQAHIQTSLPKFFESSPSSSSSAAPAISIPDISTIKTAATLAEAVKHAHIIQESTLESPSLKQDLWADVEKHASPGALFWSSTSGIPASVQSEKMIDKSRVLVVHPYNPPHIMPLLELVPSPNTKEEVVEKTQAFWTARERVPIHIKKEVPGFVANRLAFALLREAVHLVNEGVVSVEEVDKVVESSMGPRWAIAGPFKSYHMGGGPGGLEALFKNIGGTVDTCWGDAGQVRFGDGSGWEERVCEETKRAYGGDGAMSTVQRDSITRNVLAVVEKGKKEGAAEE